MSVLCCQVEVSATGWSLVQRSPTECGVFQVCDRETSKKMRRPRPPRGCRAIGKKKEKNRRSISWSDKRLLAFEEALSAWSQLAN
jgi:predicted NAD-dependent protein-ADP-ribosyltransferase YbiA (DUF1768 family)